MRITEILTESQLEQLNEGPKLDAAGRTVGGFVSGAAKGLGAVAGGVRGAFTALRKGYQTGKAIVGDDPDPNAGDPGYTPPSADDINAQGPKGSAPAKPQTGDAGKALAKTDAVTDKQTTIKAGETVYAQVKANINKLDKKGKQRILQLLTKSMSAPVAPPVKTPAAGAPTAADPAAAGGAPTAGAGAMGQMANQLAGEKPNTMANAPVSKTNVAAGPDWDAETGAPISAKAKAEYEKFSPKMKADIEQNIANQKKSATVPAARGGKVAGQVSQTPGAIAKRAKRTASASANTAGAAAIGGMANQLQQQNASKNNYGNALSEALALRVEMHKQKMFETGLARGTVSVFRK